MKTSDSARLVAMGIFASIAAAASSFAGLTSQWAFDSSTNSSTGGFTGTATTANVTVGNTVSKIIGTGSYYGNGGVTANANGNTNGYIQTTLPSIGGNSARSYSIWFRTDGDIGPADSLFGYGTGLDSGTNRFDFRLENSSSLRIQMGTAGFNWTPSTAPNNGAWRHALLTFSGTTIAGYRLYLDGVSLGNATGTTATSGISAAAIRIGTGYYRGPTATPSDRDWDGWLDDFGTFDEALSAADAALIHGLGRINGISLADFTTARTLAAATAGTRATLGGKSWERVGGLTGAVGAWGGTWLAQSAFIVTAASGQGIRMLAPNVLDSELGFSPAAETVALGFGKSAARSRQLVNASTTREARWVIAFPPSQANSSPLTDIRREVIAKAVKINQDIPDHHLLAGGESGSFIQDANVFPQSLGMRPVVQHLQNSGSTQETILNYSNDGVLLRDLSDTSSISYFTRKLDNGVWALTADLRSCPGFAINDSFYTAGTPTVELSELPLQHGNTTWRVLIRRVKASGVYTHHQLFILPNDPSITRNSEITVSYFQNSRNQLTGLPASLRLHYLFFSRPADGFYDDATCMNVARDYLAAASVPQAWLLLPTLSGRTPAATSAPFAFTVDANGVAPGTHLARWAVTPEETDPWSLPDSAFGTTTLNIAEPEFVPDRETITLSPASTTTGNIAPILLTSIPGFDLANVVVSSSQPWLTASNSENRPGQINLRYNTTGLSGTQEAVVTLTAGDTLVRIRVILTLRSLNITRLLPDPWRHRVYGIDRSSAGDDLLLVINGDDARVLKSLPAGTLATDIATSADGQYLHILSAGNGEIRRIHLDTLREVDRRKITGWLPSTATTVAHLAVGPNGRLYIRTTATYPEILVFDYEAGTIIQTTRPQTTSGVGSFAFNGDATRLIVSSGASLSSAGNRHLVSYPVTADGTLGTPTEVSLENSNKLTSVPANTRIFPSPGNGPIHHGKYTVERSSLVRSSPLFATDVLALSANGRVIFNTTGIIRADDGSTLQAAQSSFLSVQAVTADQRRLITFDISSKALAAVDLSAHAALLGRTISPAVDGSTPFSGSLQWPAVTDASQYHLYLATSAADLASVDETGTPRVPSSHLRMAVQAGTTWRPTTPLVPGSTWFWRVDALTTNGTQTGTIRSFQVPDAMPALSELRFDAVRGLSSLETPVPLALAPGLGAWSASTDASWLLAEAGGSTTPADVLKVRVQAASLAPGYHRGVVTVTANGRNARIAVTLRVRIPRISLAKADPVLPRVYAVHEDAPDDQWFGAQLLVIDSQSGDVVSQTPIGRSVTSLAVHPADNRLYLTNWQMGGVIALDRDTLGEVRRFPFPPFIGVGYSRADSNHVAAGAAGRIAVEGGDQSIELRLLDTQSGTILSNILNSAGGGAFSPDGLNYYHGSYNSGNEITRFDLQSGQFAALRTVRPPSILPYPVSGRNLLVSGNGQRIFWAGIAFDPELNEISRFGETVLECAESGGIGVTPTRVVAIAGASTLLTLPFSADHAALSPASNKLFVFRSAPTAVQSTFDVLDLTTALALPVSEPTSPIANGSVINGTLDSLSWTHDPVVRSYDVYFGTDASSVANATLGSPLFLATTSAASLVLPSALVPGTTYYWRVDRSGHYGFDKGETRSFTVFPVVLSSAVVSIRQPTQVPAPRTVLATSAITTTTWQASTTTPWIQLVSTSGSTPGNLSFDINKTGLAVGVHNGAVTITSGGRSLTVTVKLELFATNYTHVIQDPSSTTIYALNQATPNATNPAFLVRLNASTGTPVSSVEVGTYVTDIALHTAENRIYVINYGTGKLLALDRTSLGLLRTYQFDPGTSFRDAWTVSAGAAGTLMVEFRDQFGYLQLLDTVTGTVTQSYFSREGGGGFGGAGPIYWHGDNNTSDAALRKIDTLTNPMSLVTSIRPATMLSSFGNRTVVVSTSGQRIFWNGHMFDSTPASLWYVGATIIACDAEGSRALGTTAIYNTVAKSTMVTLPAGHSATDGVYSALAGRWCYISGGQLYYINQTPAPSPVAPPEASLAAGTTDPFAGEPVTITSHGLAGGRFYLEFQNPAADPETVVIETSDDLIRWLPVQDIQSGVTTDAAGIETHRVELPPDGPRRFYRVRRGTNATP